MEDDEVDEVVRRYFSAEKWENLADILKIRYRNMYRNYVNLVMAPLPDFMKPKKKIKEMPKTVDVNQNEIRVAEKRKLKEAVVVDRYPKRVVQKVNYYEKEEAREDSYVFCDKCNQEYLDFCDRCGGMLVALHDFPVKMGTVDRARKTVPRGVLEVRPSTIHGLGVFAIRNIPKGVQMGPYEGVITRVNMTNGYAWKLRDGKMIDAGLESNSNWLRYVNCARNVMEQNVVAFQYNGSLFYRTSSEIKKGEELLVYYGDSFARVLGIDTKKYFQPEEQNVDKDVFCCQYCYVGLSTLDYKEDHEIRCRYKPQKKKIYSSDNNFVCQYCEYSFTTEDFLEKHRKRCFDRQAAKKKREKEEEGKEEIATKKFQCPDCSYASKWKGNLNQHIKLMHERDTAEIFHCNKCKYKTYRKSHLIRHLRVHEKDSPFKCQKCFKGFNGKLQMDRHIFSNHKDLQHLVKRKIHKCEICDYKTANKTNLKSHINTKHFKTKAERYYCSKCNYCTIYKSNLKIHFYTHSIFKPIVCFECKKDFTEKSNLDSHILHKHIDNEELLKTITNKIHSCKMCSFRTVNICDFKKHNMRAVHLKNMKTT